MTDLTANDREIERALALLESGDKLDAVAVAEAILAHHPESPEALLILAIAALYMGNEGAALQLAERAHQLDPNCREYAEALAFMYTRVGRLGDSVYFAKLAIALEPHPRIARLLPAGMDSYQFALANATESMHMVKATAAESRGHYEEAVTEALHELRIDSRSLPANLVAIRGLLAQRQFGTALSFAQGALHFASGDAGLRILLARCLVGLGRFDEADCAIAEAWTLLAGKDEGRATELVGLAAQMGVAQQAAWETQWRAAHGGRKAPYVSKGLGLPGIGVGVLCNATTAGPLMSFLEPLMRQRHPGHVFTMYNECREEDLHTERLKNSCYRWLNAFDLDDNTLVRIMANDGIDVILDVTGVTRTSRQGLLASRPAPVTVRWLGFPDVDTPLGAQYLLSGPMTHDVDTAVHKSCVMLPRALAPFELMTERTLDLTPSALPAKLNGVLAFGGVCDLSRISPRTAALWARVLRAVPQAVLVLGYHSGIDDGVRDATMMRFANQGVAHRVLFQEAISDVEQKIGFFTMIDVMLDTAPVSCGLETAEALTMGVPVVTLAGPTRRGRMGASMLHAAGFEHFVARSEDEFVAVARRLAADIEALAQLRGDLPAKVRASALCDTAAFADDFHRALQEMLKGCG